MREMPGYLQPIYRRVKWLDLIYRSDLSAMHKLTATVLSKTTSYNRKKQLSMTNCSPYTVSRILNTSVDEARQYMNDLLELGWLWDTGRPAGARQVYVICVNLKPKELRK